MGPHLRTACCTMRQEQQQELDVEVGHAVTWPQVLHRVWKLQVGCATHVYVRCMGAHTCDRQQVWPIHGP
jgi:hypothetical protein